MFYRFALVLLFTGSVLARCAPPTYSCSRTDTSITTLPSPLPNWGGLYGANTIFTDPGFNSSYPPQYVRVTDANTAAPGSGLYSGMFVGDGSGDEKHFNADDTLFDVTDRGNNTYFFGLNPATMQTGLICALPTCRADFRGYWSQINPNAYYEVLLSGQIWWLKLPAPQCRLGGGACTPSSNFIYDFVANCGLSSTIVYHEAGGTPAANDTIFAADFSYGIQNSGDEVVVYNSTANTCYFYNTRAGTVRSYVGRQTPITGTVDMDSHGNIKLVSGSQFDPSWSGLYMNVNGTYYELSHNVTARTASFFLTSGPFTAGNNLSYSIEPGTLLGTITSADRYSVHNAKIDPGGNWLIVVSGVNCYSASCVVVHAWQVGTTNVVNCVTACGGHWTESASGWFNDGGIPGNPRNVPMTFRPWTKFGTTQASAFTYLNTSNPSLDVPINMHPSNKNDVTGTNGYPVFTSTAAAETPAGKITEPYSNEVVAYPQTPGSILRFGHTFSSGLSNNFTAEYAIGAPSSTGRFYIFTTDGEGTLGNTSGNPTCTIRQDCRSDVFILNLTPPSAQ